MGKPKLLCDTAGMDRKTWLACRAHGPAGDIEYTLGGSDISTIFGLNPWTTPQELWLIKKGRLSPTEPDNEDQLEMGHLMEPIVAHWYEKKEGHTIIGDTGLYQHGDYSWALANMDNHCQDKYTGERGIWEGKTTGWRNKDHWLEGGVPIYYELQCRFYMGVMQYPFTDISCMWDFNPNEGLVTRRIERDLVLEQMVFDKGQAFIDSLYANEEPSMADVLDPSLALKALARIYNASTTSCPSIEFSRKYEKKLRKMAQLQEEIASLREAARNKEKEFKALSVRIAETMKSHEHGLLETSADRILIDFVPSKSRRVDSGKLKMQYPVIYNSVIKESISRRLHITIEPK